MSRLTNHIFKDFTNGLDNDICNKLEGELWNELNILLGERILLSLDGALKLELIRSIIV